MLWAGGESNTSTTTTTTAAVSWVFDNGRSNGGPAGDGKKKISVERIYTFTRFVRISVSACRRCAASPASPCPSSPSLLPLLYLGKGEGNGERGRIECISVGERPSWPTSPMRSCRESISHFPLATPVTFQPCSYVHLYSH